MAVHLSRSGRRRRQSAGHPSRDSRRISTHLGDGDELVLRAAAGQPDLHDGRHDHAPQPSCGQAGRVSRVFGQFQRRRLFRDAVRRQIGAGRRFQRLARAGARHRIRPRRCWLRRAGKAEQGRAADDLSLGRTEAVRAHPRPDQGGHPKGECRRGLASAAASGGRLNMLGRLSWDAIPFNELLPLLSGAVVGIVILAVLVTVTIKGWWPYLWREWLTSVDHKRIGVMYVVLGLVMLLRGFSDAIMMRTQQAIAVGTAQGYLPPEHYDQVFSAHGTIMIFFVAMPLVIGLMNFAVPLQLGVRDVAFPTLNSISLWLTATGALLVNMSLVIGNFSRTGWMGYPPLSELAFSPDVGVDYYLWSLQISGIGTLLTGVNFVTTILKLRAPGMTYMRMPVFCWTALAANMLIVAAFPVLTATFAMLLLDRYLGMHFFTNDAGGNQMMYANL